MSLGLSSLAQRCLSLERRVPAGAECCIDIWIVPRDSVFTQQATEVTIDVKNVSYVFFILVTFLTFFNDFFYFPNVFLF